MRSQNPLKMNQMNQPPPGLLLLFRFDIRISLIFSLTKTMYNNVHAGIYAIT